MTTLDDIKTFAKDNYTADNFLSLLAAKFGGSVENTGGGVLVWGLCYDGKHMVSVTDDCLCVIEATTWEEWFENGDSGIQEHTIYFAESDDDILESALNAACRVIQDSLGVKSGDVGGMFFDGDSDNKDAFKDVMRRYMAAERMYI